MIDIEFKDVLFSVPSVGSRTFSGPLLLSIQQAEKSDSQGILLVKSLDPSQVGILSKIGGLVLLTEGPCSHIVLLAKSFGIAVLCQARDYVEIDQNNQICKVSESILQIGQVLTISEKAGSLCMGPLRQIDSVGVENENSEKTISTEYLSLSTPESFFNASNSYRVSKVGLCRSEMQLFSYYCQQDFQEYFKNTLLRIKTEIPNSVKDRLRISLDKMLSYNDLAFFNYRILDAATTEYIDHSVIHKHNLPTLRGPKWSIESGFYEWQIGMAIESYQASNLPDCSFFITVPSISFLSELVLIRKIFERKLEKIPQKEKQPKFGVMIENAGAANDVVSYLPFVDLVCFGLNDLTQSVTGLERNSWPSVLHYYIANSLIEDDPYMHIEASDTFSIFDTALKAVIGSGPNIDILVCGNSSISVNLDNYDPKKIGITIEPDRKISFSARTKKIIQPINYERSRHSLALKRVISARTISDKDLAKEVSLEWADPFNAPQSRNWKVFKKNVVADHFGKLPGKFLAPGWDISEATKEIRLILEEGMTPRCSEFTDSISCHSKSYEIPNKFSDNEIHIFLEEFSDTSFVHIFPQQSVHDMCFRLYLTESELLIEAGIGQAMYIFEEHRETSTTIKVSGDSSLANISYFGGDLELQKVVKNFVNDCLSEIVSESKKCIFRLGLETLGVEGYYILSSGEFLVVDIDLPLDLAWN